MQGLAMSFEVFAVLKSVAASCVLTDEWLPMLSVYVLAVEALACDESPNK